MQRSRDGVEFHIVAAAADGDQYSVPKVNQSINTNC